MSTKFCINCRFRSTERDVAGDGGFSARHSRCLHEKAATETEDWRVTGEPQSEQAFCSVMRLGSQPCGHEGALFEPKVAA